MFWDKNYTPQNIEALLEKEDVTVEDFLEEDDIIQECKTQKKVILNYFTRPDVIRHLVELIVTEPSEELPMCRRFRHANIACEILTLGLPSLVEKLLDDAETLKLLYSYLENEPPLNPLLASFFSKTFRTLFTKKSDQDWFLYQQMCLKLLEYLKLKNNFLDLICMHFTSPVITDLILQMMDSVAGVQLKRSLYVWFNEQQLVEKLISILGDPQEREKHGNVSEFFCDLIEHGRTMRQTEYENDTYESTFEGSNPILGNIESASTLEALFNVILQPNALESSMVSGITVVLKIIKPVFITDEPNPDRLKMLHDRERQTHDCLLTTVIRVIENHLQNFIDLLENPPEKPDITITGGKLSPPLGMTRLQICRLFTVLLQTNNEDITKAICGTDFFNILLRLFRQYYWNNILQSEVEKCVQIIFYNSYGVNSISNNSTHVSDGSWSKRSNLAGNNFFSNVSDNIFNAKQNAVHITRKPSGIFPNFLNRFEDPISGCNSNAQFTESNEETNEDEPYIDGPCGDDEYGIDIDGNNGFRGFGVSPIPPFQLSNTNVEVAPSILQMHVIVKCKIISKLLDCWEYNRAMQSAEGGRRLGYMGFLLKIFDQVNCCISESEHIGALIEQNFRDDEERALWYSVVRNDDGEVAQSLAIQNRHLANWNVNTCCEDGISIVDNYTDNILHLTDNTDVDIIFAIDYNASHEVADNDDNDDNDEYNVSDIHGRRNNCVGCAKYNDNKNKNNDRHEADLGDSDDGRELQKVNNTLNLFQLNDDEEEDTEENAAGGDGYTFFNRNTGILESYDSMDNSWANLIRSNDADVLWNNDFNRNSFADFDAHFNTFSNDMGESLHSSINTGDDKSNQPESGIMEKAIALMELRNQASTVSTITTPDPVIVYAKPVSATSFVPFLPYTSYVISNSRENDNNDISGEPINNDPLLNNISSCNNKNIMISDNNTNVEKDIWMSNFKPFHLNTEEGSKDEKSFDNNLDVWMQPSANEAQSDAMVLTLSQAAQTDKIDVAYAAVQVKCSVNENSMTNGPIIHNMYPHQEVLVVEALTGGIEVHDEEVELGDEDENDVCGVDIDYDDDDEYDEQLDTFKSWRLKPFMMNGKTAGKSKSVTYTPNDLIEDELVITKSVDSESSDNNFVYNIEIKKISKDVRQLDAKQEIKSQESKDMQSGTIEEQNEEKQQKSNRKLELSQELESNQDSALRQYTEEQKNHQLEPKQELEKNEHLELKKMVDTKIEWEKAAHGEA